MPLPDNVKSIAGRGPGTRRPRPNAPATRSTPFDSLLGLAIELEQRQPPAPPRHLSPAPDPDVLPAPPNPDADGAVWSPTASAASVTTSGRPSRSTENFLIGVACVLVALIAALLIWGDQLERLLRPGLDADGIATEESIEPKLTPDVDEPASDSPAPVDDPSPSSAPTTSPSTVEAPAPTANAPADPAAGAAASAAAVAVACDTSSVWPAVAPLNDIGPVTVAWVTCLDRFATAGLVPADSPPETPASFVAALRADGGVWTMISGGAPVACAAGATAADPAFPAARCG